MIAVQKWTEVQKIRLTKEQRDKIKEALDLISTLCKETNSNCSLCPFRDGEGEYPPCRLVEFPDEWGEIEIDGDTNNET